MFDRRFFIVSPNFHGATLLSKLLNDHPDIVSLGDTYPTNRYDQVCGCGDHVSQCSFWREVFQQVRVNRYSHEPHILPDYPRILSRRVDRIFYNTLPLAALHFLISNKSGSEFVESFEAFVEVVSQESGKPDASVYVDGVKSISRVYALMALGVKVDGVIHLVRDPGDYAASTMKNFEQSWKVFGGALVQYRVFHNRVRALGRKLPYLSVSYESLSDCPEDTLEKLFGFLRVAPLSINELIESPANNNRPWHFMGNSSLLEFDGVIKRSRYKISAWQKLWVRFLAGSYVY